MQVHGVYVHSFSFKIKNLLPPCLGRFCEDFTATVYDVLKLKLSWKSLASGPTCFWAKSVRALLHAWATDASLQLLQSRLCVCRTEKTCWFHALVMSHSLHLGIPFGLALPIGENYLQEMVSRLENNQKENQSSCWWTIVWTEHEIKKIYWWVGMQRQMCYVAGQVVSDCVQKWGKKLSSMHLRYFYAFHLACQLLQIMLLFLEPAVLLYCTARGGAQGGLVVYLCLLPAHSCCCLLEITGTVSVFSSPPHPHPSLFCGEKESQQKWASGKEATLI